MAGIKHLAPKYIAFPPGVRVLRQSESVYRSDICDAIIAKFVLGGHLGVYRACGGRRRGIYVYKSAHYHITRWIFVGNCNSHSSSNWRIGNLCFCCSCESSEKRNQKK